MFILRLGKNQTIFNQEGIGYIYWKKFNDSVKNNHTNIKILFVFNLYKYDQFQKNLFVKSVLSFNLVMPGYDFGLWHDYIRIIR